MLDVNDLKNKVIGFYDGEDERNNVVCYVKEHARLTPERVAFQWPINREEVDWANMRPQYIHHRYINYRDFFNLAAKTAAGLKELGVEKYDTVIIFVPMSVEMYQALTAVMMIGAKAVFLDSWARRKHLGACAENVKPKAMISTAKAFELCKNVRVIKEIPVKILTADEKQPGFSALLSEMPGEREPAGIEPVKPGDTALITFTTGSSGAPKGANRTHCFLSSQHQALNQVIPYNSADMDMPAFPIFSLNNMASGVNTVIPIVDVGSPGEYDAVMLVSQLQSAGATCVTLSPSMITAVADYCKDHGELLPLIQRAVTGGAPLGNNVIRKFQKCLPNGRLLILYGSTEVEPIAHIEAEEILKTDMTSSREGVNVGRPVSYLDYKLIKIIRRPINLENDDWTRYEVPAGNVGELIVSGIHVCRSYYNNPKADKMTKIVESDGKLWHRTGDLARIDSEGNIWLVGRVHNVISRDGQLLYPVKVELLIKKLPRVRQAAYLGLPDPSINEKAVAVVTIDKDPFVIPHKILQHIAETLVEEKIPFDFLGVVDNIPMDPRHHSKVDYKLMRDNLEKMLGNVHGGSIM